MNGNLQKDENIFKNSHSIFIYVNIYETRIVCLQKLIWHIGRT